MQNKFIKISSFILLIVTLISCSASREQTELTELNLYNDGNTLLLTNDADSTAIFIYPSFYKNGMYKNREVVELITSAKIQARDFFPIYWDTVSVLYDEEGWHTTSFGEFKVNEVKSEDNVKIAEPLEYMFLEIAETDYRDDLDIIKVKQNFYETKSRYILKKLSDDKFKLKMEQLEL